MPDVFTEIYLLSVRAWRGLRFNEKYAKKLEAKLAQKKQKEEEKLKAEKARQESEAARKVNPFSVRFSLAILTVNYSHTGKYP